MILAMDFDGTLVETPLTFGGVLVLQRGVREALQKLKSAGHTLIVFSARANQSLRKDWRLNPLWRDGILPLDETAWAECQVEHEQHYQQMCTFIKTELAGLIDAVDDGGQGKPLADLFLDDCALTVDDNWADIAQLFGEDLDQ